MAYTTPRTWVAGETVTAANLNTHVRDNEIALYGTDSSYTPTLSQGASTNIAKTVNHARYVQVGRLVHCYVTLTSTAAGTAGSAITVTLPVTASGHVNPQTLGNGYYYDASATTYYTMAAFYATSTTVQFIADNASAGVVGTTPAVTVASSDIVSFHVVYFVA
jgi:hypothetical protein